MATEQSDPDFRIDDPEEFSQKKRVREILNRRKDVLDARDAAKQELLAGNVTKEQAVGIYQSRIETLIIDLWSKLNDDEMGEGKKILTEETIVEKTVAPPRKILPEDQSAYAAGVDVPEPKTVAINGLQWFLENDPVVQVPFKVRMWNPPEVKTVYAEEVLDFTDLDGAVTKCVEFINETGIDADLAEGEQQVKIDRSLMEELHEWRQENTN